MDLKLFFCLVSITIKKIFVDVNEVLFQLQVFPFNLAVAF